MPAVSGTKVPFRSEVPGSGSHLPTPWELRAMVIVAIFSIVFALVVGIMQTLEIYPNVVPIRAFLFAVVFFVLPVLIIVLVSADNSWGRFCVCLFLVGGAAFYALVDKTVAVFPERDESVAAISLVCAVLLSVWFYQSANIRGYVRRLRSGGDALVVKRGVSTASNVDMASIRRRAAILNVLEIATVIVLIALVVGAIVQTNNQW
ncbi:MAG: hypothetical protein AAFN07_06195 [Pseudomonadota bacterium]